MSQLLNFDPRSEALSKAELTRESQRHVTCGAFDALDVIVGSVVDRAALRLHALSDKPDRVAPPK